MDAVILLAVIGLLRTGIRRGSGELFTTGTLFFLIWTVCRYCDYFLEDGGMIGAAIMFFACSAFLWGIAWFWGRCKKNQAVESADDSGGERLSSGCSSGCGSPEGGDTAMGTAVEPVSGEPEPGFACCCGRDREHCWCLRHERIVLIAGVLFQVAVLVGMIVTRTVPYLESLGGKTVLLKVEPVDPRDPFQGDLLRGECVTLSYESDRRPRPRTLGHASEIFVTLLPDESEAARGTDPDELTGPGNREDVQRYRMGEFSLTRPTDTVYLRGRVVRGATRGSGFCDFRIGQYFVQDGNGREIEEAMRSPGKSVWAEVRIGRDGHGQVQRLVIDSSLPDDPEGEAIRNEVESADPESPE
ncbi:MAG: GDYXXLXY domain-containing protein, partial [Planctomycetia bacterium]|nr:GDYXXLXY domain-containing protein [Planctomycetia bacterium]